MFKFQSEMGPNLGLRPNNGTQWSVSRVISPCDLWFTVNVFKVIVAVDPHHFGVGQQLDLALLGEVHDLLHAVEVATESFATVHQGHFAGHAVGEENGPVQGAVPSP